MALRIRDSLTPEGRKFMNVLQELADKEIRVGFQRGKDTDDEGTDICDIAAWNELGTEDIPSRPFLRKSVDENEDVIREFVHGKMGDILNGASAEQVLKEIGLFQKDLIQDKITNGTYTPNAASTVKKKQSSKPLIDTGRMRQSVNYEIVKRGSRDE